MPYQSHIPYMWGMSPTRARLLRDGTLTGGGPGSGVDNLLLENGDDLLLEDGTSVLLLEP